MQYKNLPKFSRENEGSENCSIFDGKPVLTVSLGRIYQSNVLKMSHLLHLDFGWHFLFAPRFFKNALSELTKACL